MPRDVLLHVEVETKFLEAIDGRTSHYSMHLTMRSGKPVISVVVFLSGGPKKGIEHREVFEEVEPWEIRRFRYLAFALSKCLAENYVGRPQALAPALAALMRSKVWDKVEQKLRCLKAISRFKGLDIAKKFVLARIVNTYLKLDEDEALRFAAELERETAKEVREMAITWEETLAEREAKGLAEGLIEGEIKGEVRGEVRGEARGKLEGVRQAICLLMKHRCNLTPAEEDLLADKLQAVSDLHRLYEILEQAGDARSLDDLDLE